ncbi:hypothetical protein, partial [Sinomicrobium pectinilyticum]|uniref:hypothetical protein n=1 Tax=Sinomicrobium pectinilyticum TaxID=1084421 RepID=UPI0019D2DC6F
SSARSYLKNIRVSVAKKRTLQIQIVLGCLIIGTKGKKTAIKAIPLTPEVVGLAAKPFPSAAKQVALTA